MELRHERCTFPHVHDVHVIRIHQNYSIVKELIPEPSPHERRNRAFVGTPVRPRRVDRHFFAKPPVLPCYRTLSSHVNRPGKIIFLEQGPKIANIAETFIFMYLRDD